MYVRYDVRAGLNVLEVIANLREVDDADLQIQCDVFDDEKHDDDEELAAASHCLDLNSHSDLFTAIYDRVGNTVTLLRVVAAILTGGLAHDRVNRTEA